jgi:hypothetical protein
MIRFPSILCNLLILLSISISGTVFASTTVETRIQDLITPIQSGESVRILSTADGRVYDLDGKNPELLARLTRARATHAVLSLTLDSNEKVVSAVELAAPKAVQYSDKLDEAVTTATIADSHDLGYQASNLSSMSDAQSLFDSLPQLKHNSQCFQRAHVWARQMFEERSVYSMKVFLFFTRAFIQEHHYKWWFHVAPFVYVQGAEIVLDPEFVRQPRPMHDWTDFFMMDQSFVRPALDTSPDCTEVANYSEYENNQSVQLCYTLKLPMYYYQPRDAENLAKEGTRVEEFRAWDVSNSHNALP